MTIETAESSMLMSDARKLAGGRWLGLRVYAVLNDPLVRSSWDETALYVFAESGIPTVLRVCRS